MSQKVTGKVLKKQKETMEKLMTVFGDNYNEWLYAKQEEYINENNEKALEHLLNERERFLSTIEEGKEEDESVDEDPSLSDQNNNMKVKMEG